MEKCGCPKTNSRPLHWQEDSLAYSMLIIAIYLIWSKGHCEPWNEVGFQSLANHIIRVWTYNLWTRSWSNGLAIKVLNSKSRFPWFKTSEWFQGRLNFHSFEVDEMGAKCSWEPKGKKWTASLQWLCILGIVEPRP